MSKMLIIAVSGLAFATVVSFWNVGLMVANFVASFFDILHILVYFYIFAKGHDISKWTAKKFLAAHLEYRQPSKYDLLVRKLKRKFKRKFKQFKKDWASRYQTMKGFE